MLALLVLALVALFVTLCTAVRVGSSSSPSSSSSSANTVASPLWRDCTIGATWFNVSNVGVTPPNPKHGTFVRIDFQAAWTQTVTGGSINFTMQFNGKPFKQVVRDLCHSLQLAHKFDPAISECPVPPAPAPGFAFKSAPIFVPASVPIGTFVARLELQDANSTVFSCMELDLTIRP
jgi:hypothetical protein